MSSLPLDFSLNVNPLGPPEWLRSVVSRHVSSLTQPPDPDAPELREAIARHHGVTPEQVVVGSGLSDVCHGIARAVRTSAAVVLAPTDTDYAQASRAAALTVRELLLDEADGFAVDLAQLARALGGDELVWLGQPNDPTGRLVPRDQLERFVREHAGPVFVIDETYSSFVEGYASLADGRPDNVVVVRSTTEHCCTPGLPLAYAVARAGLAARIRSHVAPGPVNSLAQAVAMKALGDGLFAERTRRFAVERRRELDARLRRLPDVTVFPSEANFVLLRLERTDSDATELAGKLRERGLTIRVWQSLLGLNRRYFRVALRAAEENARLCEALQQVLDPPPKRPKTRRARALMLQGTSSNVGKSVLAAALCRILLQEGVRVAPFKAQNLSLNSYVTRDGGEMGRAQVVQAQACRLEPEVRMNPVLLKPSRETGCQVIVKGKPVEPDRTGERGEYQTLAFDAAAECYDSLAAEFDAVVLEGAGSPGEVNLKHLDIVNMRMARHANAPVLLVGDIDRGGVYASFVGTMEVLAEWERKLVAGFLCNRFRGDASQLESAHQYVLDHTGKPVLGVVPFLHDLGLPEEDSVELKSGALDDAQPDGEHVEIAVVELPHLSNFTDLDALRGEPDVWVRLVRTTEDLGAPDALILPGSKNVPGDMHWLRVTGLGRQIADLAASRQTEIIGLCGGYQMLGGEIRDPHRVESSLGRAEGLGLLDMATELAREKTLVRTNATHGPSGHAVRGYEIHHGETNTRSLTPVLTATNEAIVGGGTPDGRLWGTYLHGVFDADAFRRWFVDRLRQRRGLSPIGEVVAPYDLEPALDRVADVVRESLDMEAVWRLLRL